MDPPAERGVVPELQLEPMRAGGHLLEIHHRDPAPGLAVGTANPLGQGVLGAIQKQSGSPLLAGEINVEGQTGNRRQGRELVLLVLRLPTPSSKNG